MKTSVTITGIFLCCSITTIALSQTDTLESYPRSYLKFNYDNDLFSTTDRYYTQGIYLDLSAPFIKKIPSSKILIRLNNTSTDNYGIHLEQDVFTPKEITHEGIWLGERPYSGIFFITNFLISTDAQKRQRLVTEVCLGIIGAAALGEEEQKAIHRATNSDQPLGWEYQIAQDIILNYNMQLEQGLFIKKGMELIGFTKTRVGTLYDDIGVGSKLRLGWMRENFKNTELMKQKKEKKFQCYISGSAEIKAVGYNATLQGGIFDRKSVYTIADSDITRLVRYADVGMVMGFKLISIEFTKTFISPEFRNGLTQSWGHFAITVCF